MPCIGKCPDRIRPQLGGVGSRRMDSAWFCNDLGTISRLTVPRITVIYEHLEAGGRTDE